MKYYNNFRKEAQLNYCISIRVYVRSGRFDDALAGEAYLSAYLQGIIHGLIMAGVASVEEVDACRQYAKIVEKAYHHNYIAKHLPSSK